MVKKKNSINDKILTVVFVVATLLTFYLIGMVNASFQNDVDSISLYKTNSSTNFPSYPITEYPYTTWDNMTSSVQTGGTLIAQYEKTPVYLGNDTWSMSVNSTPSGFTGRAVYVIELPNLDEWLIDEIVINQTKNSDSDLKFEFYIVSLATANFVYGEGGGVLVDTDSIGSLSANRTISPTLSTALDVYDKAQDKPNHFIQVVISDESNDGLSAWAWNMEIEIKGKQTATYNIIQQLEIVIGIGITIDIFLLLFMNDRIDLGGYVNDIPDKKRR